MNPNEVVWKSLRISWWQRVIRRMAVLGFITALIVFWAIPVAFVGLVSNIQYLMTYSWLQWLDKIPTAIMGVISGLLPSVLLAILMSLVPIIMRSKHSHLCLSTWLTVNSLCQTCWRTIAGTCRALHTKCILCLPGCPGVPCCYSCFSGFISHQDN